jgi:4-hydroxybutyrate CoA-transferase
VTPPDFAGAFGDRWGTPEAVARQVPDGVDLGCGLIEPTALLGALSHREVGGSAMIAVMGFGSLALALAGRYAIRTGFASPVSTPLLEQGRCEYLPLSFFEAARYVRDHPPACALVRLSPPDGDGLCSFGWAAGFSPELVESAQRTGAPILAEIDPDMPCSRPGGVHVDAIAGACLAGGDAAIDEPLPPSRHAEAIARHVDELVPDGATLQVGIGSVPDSVVERLSARDLGIHTEVLGRGLARLMARGRATGTRKAVDVGTAICTIASRDDDVRAQVEVPGRVDVRSASATLDPRVVASHDRMRCINSALAVDLRGQINAETIGTSQIAGVGGQIDFLRGAGLRDDALRIIAMGSVTSKGESRILSGHPPGVVITATRYDVDVVVTEHGTAWLRDRTDEERARNLIAVAHPSHREALEAARFGG